jgi:hypothetical protein
MYVIPRIMSYIPGRYTIAIGWFGREFLYRHLVDEYWEIDESCQWLRDYAKAFHHDSENLKKIELWAEKYGRVIEAEKMGRYCTAVICGNCKAFYCSLEPMERCEKCGSRNMEQSLFADIKGWRERVKPIPLPSYQKLKIASEYLGPNPVAVFARGRKTYGRNLPPEFYVELLKDIESIGCTPIWMGEKQSTLPCPVSHVLDYSRLPEARDLELTLAIISQCLFTIQFWTASTRLAAMTKTPFLLFESPDQIMGLGQEGYRLQLTTFGFRKLVFSDFINSLDNLPQMLNVAGQAMRQFLQGDARDCIGILQDKNQFNAMFKKWAPRLGWGLDGRIFGS